MKKIGLLASMMAALCITAAPAVQAQELYWASSGMFGPFNIQGLIPTFPEAKQVTIPVAMWILKHPKGVVVIDMQLKKVGLSVTDVKVLITSHTHLDHGGNMGMFPKAIHVVQKKEMYQGWWPEKFQGRGVGDFVMADLNAARGYNYLELDGDYDLFGDGTVQIISTPGHTIGHQSVKVKLPGSGTFIIAQDAIWMQEILDGYVAGLNFSVQAFTGSVNRLKMMADLEGAKILMPHDAAQFGKMGDRWHK